MKAIHIIFLIIGIFLLLGTESNFGTTNIIGLLIVWFECYNLKLFDYENGRTNGKSCNVW